jgi:hypothetical protein
MSIQEKQMGCLSVVTVVDQYTIRLRVKKDNVNAEPGFKDEEY